ncbi:hypothetical protein QEZ40_006312 [Streptomyces katrae]|uniref:Uncharacterized protein n=1 Tax=Streptomyces katrae TaxID=68223 RepID=A0ABT7H5Z3_9ACTN|nr:hypothetical protein [Streptomyces katrae]MDK9500490.1 hypothetical protein [Streptomyces katrae]
MAGQPYAIRLSPHAAGVLAGLPEDAGAAAWEVLDRASAGPWGFAQWDAGDPDGEDVRIASAGGLYVVYWVNRPLRRLSVLDVVWLG